MKSDVKGTVRRAVAYVLEEIFCIPAKPDIRFLARAAVIAALYAVLTLLLWVISFGPVQFRVSEALTLLPILTPAACEGTSNLFETNYFGDKAYLSQSGQLYLEPAAAALGKVYCFGPTFRAEKSKTRRHLMEFWMIEPEIAFADLEECIDWEEKSVEYVVQRVLRNRRVELETLERDTSRLEKVVAPFPRISYDEALELLHKAGEELPWGEDFGGGHETIISDNFEDAMNAAARRAEAA